MFKKTFIAAAIAVTLVSTVGAQAADPTQGRLDQREAARKQQQFNKCTKFSNRVFNDCMGRANGAPLGSASAVRSYGPTSLDVGKGINSNPKIGGARRRVGATRTG